MADTVAAAGAERAARSMGREQTRNTIRPAHHIHPLPTVKTCPDKNIIIHNLHSHQSYPYRTPSWPNLRAKRVRAHCVEYVLTAWSTTPLGAPERAVTASTAATRGFPSAAKDVPITWILWYPAPSRRPCRPRAARGSGDCVDRVQSRLRLWELPSAAAIPHVAHPPWPQFPPLSPNSSHLAKIRKIDRFRTFFDQNRVVFSRAMWYKKNNAFCTERTENA